jgi:hypothetical protein
MKRLIGLIVSGLAVSGLLTAQTLNVQVGQVTYQFPSAQTGEMPYENGTSLTVMGKVFALSEISNMYVDETKVTDNTVKVAYNDANAAITVAGNIAKDLTIAYKGAHVSIIQSEDVVSEITYTLSGSSSDGGFYNEGAYKATVELNGLTLTNVSATYSGAAVHIQNSKRIKVKPLKGTTSTLVDAASGKQKGCLYIKGHAEFAQAGTLNITGNVKHGIKTGEYFTIKNSVINILSAAGDGINCEQYFLMESGTISIKNVADDGIQCDIEDTTVGSTGVTTDHEEEDSGNMYISGGTITAAVTGDACKGLKSEGDMYISGGTITITTAGGGVWDATNLKAKACSCLSADGLMDISGGTMTLTSTGAGGKGLSADGNLTVSGNAVITIVTSGQAVVASSTGSLSICSNSSTLDLYDSDYKCSPKGIKIDGAIIINGGTINVTTSGAGGEGIESKQTLTINDGHITVNAFDDGINCSSDMTINGGYIFAKGSKNDAMDANGNMYVKGGLIYAIGATNPEVALDANTEEGKKLYITGGTIIAVGNLEGGAQISGGTCKYTTSWTANAWYALYNGGTLVAAFQTPSKTTSSGGMGGMGGSSSQKLVVYTSSTPTLKSGVSVSNGTEYFSGLANIGGTVSGGTSVTLSNYSSSGGGFGW